MNVKKIALPVIVMMIACLTAPAQKKAAPANGLERPKLVVGIVVDQMRWDYLFRYYDKYGNGGFKRLLNEGFSCDNTMLNYIPSETAVGHSTIYTGTVPSIHGIAGNDWLDYKTKKSFYCTDDSTVQSVGATTKAGKMSPRNLLATTITDELRLGTNMHSKVVGVSLKDRASILPAGHNPTAAFWLDDASGNFITSTWYMNSLPLWVDKFNGEKLPQKLVADGWNTLLPIDQYTESTADDVPWEGIMKGASKATFPYDTKKSYETEHSILRQTPFGNTLTLKFARAAVDGYMLGQDASTDFLAINCASTDYQGHLTGPNSVEVEDVYLRLDRDLAAFFVYLDQKIGKGNYLVFLAADHGASLSEGFMQATKMPTGLLPKGMEQNLNALLKQRFGFDNLVLSTDSYQIWFDESKLDTLNIDREKIYSVTANFLQSQPGILYAAPQDKIALASIPQAVKEKIINGYFRNRSGAVVFIPKAGWLPAYSTKGTTHGQWNPYDAHIPLIFMGWHIKAGSTSAPTFMTDIAPTLATLLHIQVPSGCIGTPIADVLKK
jgi:predicted AlkP superfamily pyrophosphatase or phosphodiesterase